MTSHWWRVMKIVSRVIHDTFIDLCRNCNGRACIPSDASEDAAAGESGVDRQPATHVSEAIASSMDPMRTVAVIIG